MKRLYSILSFALLMLLFFSSTRLAWSRESASIPSAVRDNNELAEQLLRRSFDYYRGLDSFSMRLTTDLCLNTAGKTTHKVDSALLQIGKSKSIKIRMVSPKNAGEVSASNSEAYFYSPKWNVYASRPISAPGKVLKESDFAFITDGAFGDALISELIAEDPYSAFMKDRIVKTYDGVEKVGDKLCHHISLTKSGTTCVQQIWISTGDKPWIEMFKPSSDCPLIIFPKKEGSPEGAVTLTVRFQGSKDNKRLNHLVSNRPRRATKVDQLVGSGDADARQSLVGQSAPDVKLRTITGGTFKLSRQKGKVTIIDFWATWCGPCCHALPILDQVAKSYADRGVQLVAINEKESPSDIQAFLSKASLDVVVGLDVVGDIAQRYRVVGIPQTVIIGRDGKVKFLQVGFGPNLKNRLSRELESLL